jgi:hypothetical protein
LLGKGNNSQTSSALASKPGGKLGKVSKIPILREIKKNINNFCSTVSQP